MKKKDNK